MARRWASGLLTVIVAIGGAATERTSTAAAETGTPVVSAATSESAAAAATLKERAAELVAALASYRASLGAVLEFREAALAKAIATRDARHGFYERGFISRRELEQSEAVVAAEQRQVDETRRLIDSADEAAAEAQATEALAALPPPTPGVEQRTDTIVRYQGGGGWSLSGDATRLAQMFEARFGRVLPISAYGQTAVHDRMGFDHHNALDIAVHPDSAEGRAILGYLRAAGIPFMAWRGAVPGAATGAHIHVGQPSPRIAVRR